MGVFVAIVLIAIGLFVIVKGGDWFVDSAIWFAKVAHIPQIIIGATIVSLGTTLPELFTSMTSVAIGLSSGASESFNQIAIGNAIGSKMCNIGLILAIVIIIRPQTVDRLSFAPKAFCLLGVSCLVTLFFFTGGKLVLWEGIVLLLLFVGFIALNFYEGKKVNKKIRSQMLKAEEFKKDGKTILINIIQFIVGAVAMSFGAYVLVTNVQVVCSIIGIPTQIIGITVVAIGTSLPELVTNITALKKKSDIGIGNIIGANILNGTLILGAITCMSGGIVIDFFTKNVAILVMLLITTVLVIPTVIRRKTSRIQGVALLAMYSALIVANIIYVIKV